MEKMEDVLAADAEARRIAKEEIKRLTAKGMAMSSN
jgi:hypothetical protein